VKKWNVAIHPEAESELDSLPSDMKARFLRITELLEDFGPQQVGMPHVRPLLNKLWEMRMHGRDGIARAVYIAHQDQQLLVLHIFVKKTQDTPGSAINMALKRLRSLQ
jgi:phage-related protein